MIDTSFASFSEHFLERSSFESSPSFFQRIRINRKIGIKGKNRRKDRYRAIVFEILLTVSSSSLELLGNFSLTTSDG